MLEEVNVTGVVNPPTERPASRSAAREPVRQSARESWTEVTPTEQGNGPSAATEEPAVEAEARPERCLSRQARRPRGAMLVDSTGSTAETEGRILRNETHTIS